MNAKFISLEDFANKAKQEEKFTLLETYSKSGATKYYDLYLSKDNFLKEEKQKKHKIIYEGYAQNIPKDFLKYPLEQTLDMCIDIYYHNHQKIINKTFLKEKEKEHSIFKKEYREKNMEFVKAHIPFCVGRDYNENLFLNPTEKLIEVLKNEDDLWFENTELELSDLSISYRINSIKDIDILDDDTFMMITVLLKAVKDGHLYINEMGYKDGYWDWDKYKQ